MLLWLLVAAGPVLGGAAWLKASSPPPPTVPEHGTDERTGVLGARAVGELAVAEFLAAGGSDAGSSVGGWVGGGGGSWDWYCSRTVAVDARAAGDGSFVVVVAAEVVGRDRRGPGVDVWVSLGAWFFEVEVTATDVGWSVSGIPALVNGPTIQSSPPRSNATAGALDRPVERAVVGFLTALLTGEGDVSRWVAPESEIAGLSRPFFEFVELVSASAVTSGGGVVVRAVVSAVDAAGRLMLLEYSLVLVNREGRWEVSELRPGATLAGGRIREGVGG